MKFQFRILALLLICAMAPTANADSRNKEEQKNNVAASPTEILWDLAYPAIAALLVEAVDLKMKGPKCIKRTIHAGNFLYILSTIAPKMDLQVIYEMYKKAFDMNYSSKN